LTAGLLKKDRLIVFIERQIVVFEPAPWFPNVAGLPVRSMFNHQKCSIVSFSPLTD